MSDLCKYSKKIHKNNVEILECTIADSYCAFFRFCTNDWCLKMTPAADNCIQKYIYEQKEVSMKTDANIVKEDEVVEEIEQLEEKLIEKKYKVIAIKETFIVLEDEDGNISSIESKSPTFVVGDIY